MSVKSLPCHAKPMFYQFAMLQGNVDDGGDNGLSGQCKSTSSVSITDTEVSLSKLSLVDENQQGKDCCSAELEVRLMYSSFYVLCRKCTILHEIMLSLSWPVFVFSTIL